MELSVPAGPVFLDISLVVRQWIHANVLEHYYRDSPLDYAENVVVGSGP